MVTARRRIDRNVLWVLATGFTLTILLLLGSGFMGIQAIEAVEPRGAALLERHRISTQLIDEIQGEEAGLSGVFYAVTSGEQVNREQLLERLQSIERDVNRTLRSARAGSNAERWKGANVAVERFIAEVRRMLNGPDGPAKPSVDLFKIHEELMQEISTLVSNNYQVAIEQETQEAVSHRQQLRRAFALLGAALALAIVCAAATVWIAARVFQRVEWQARELSRLSGHILDSHEQALHRFSRELHDEFGQSLTAIEANLAAIPADSREVAARVEDCLLLVKDAMGNVRELSQLLRPSTLDDFGLVPSLQSLAESFSQRTGIEVRQQLKFEGRLHGETETHLFRIVQEALTNIARHSGATEARISLGRRGRFLRLTVEDNGSGFKPGTRRGFGLAGMRERMRLTGGDIEIKSTSKGITVIAEVELDGAGRTEANQRAAGG